MGFKTFRCCPDVIVTAEITHLGQMVSPISFPLIPNNYPQYLFAPTMTYRKSKLEEGMEGAELFDDYGRVVRCLPKA